MTGYVIRRLVLVGVVLVAVSMLVFAITAILPGSVAHLILGPFAPPEQVQGAGIEARPQRSAVAAVLALGLAPRHRRLRPLDC